VARDSYVSHKKVTEIKMKKAFTLIELLVVIAIIAILAAILFPVFAQAKLAAKKISDLSNMKQIGTASMLYFNDSDDLFYPHRDNCNTPNWHICSEYLDGNGNISPQFQNLGDTSGGQTGGSNSSLSRFFYIYMLLPYTRSQNLFINPAGTGAFTGDTGPKVQCTGAGCTGQDYGGQNSYGHNDAYLSPAAPFSGGPATITPVSTTSLPRTASTIMLVDSTYYGAAPDVSNETGLLDLTKLNGNEVNWVSQGGKAPFYLNYWANIGGSKWSYAGGPALTFGSALVAHDIQNGKSLFNNAINCQFADGHAKSIDYTQVIGNICLWTSDADGAHPNCGG